MTDREPAAGSGSGDPTVTNRRTFLQLAGSTAGVGLSATVASAGRTRSGGDVRIAASDAQAEHARAVADAVRAARSGPAVSVRVRETSTGLARLVAGEVDLVAASRPMLPAERSRAADAGLEYRRRELPTAVAALRHPESSWLDPLSPAGIAESWRREGAVDTWAEVRREAADTGTVTDEGPESRARPVGDGTVLVRGVRSHQYASGYGGLGYYEPDGDWLVDRPRRDGDSHTPLVRLAFLYVDRDSLRGDPVAAVVRTFARRSEERVGSVPYYESPLAGG